MANIFEATQASWSTGDTIFIVFLVLVVLIILYAVTLIHNKLRVIESEIHAIRKDQLVISEEMELMASIQKRSQSIKNE